MQTIKIILLLLIFTLASHANIPPQITYNTVHQLTKEIVTNDLNGNNTTTTFSYDEVGDLVTKTIDGTSTSYSYNANDQLTQQGTSTFTYDANGNLIQKDSIAYEYDELNRLTKVTTPTDTIEYSYDANDNRIAKTTNNGTTTYLVDTNTAYAQVITESKSNGTTVEYTYGNDLLSNGSEFYLTDALGSTRGLVDSTETLTDSYSYTPYGELSNHEGMSENSFLFTGEQLDAETEDYYLRARYYSPQQARFTSIDPFEGRMFEPITLNDYIYAGNNPVLYVDPSGEFFGLGAMLSGMSRIMTALPRMGRPLARIGVGSLRLFVGRISAQARSLSYKVKRVHLEGGPGNKSKFLRETYPNGLIRRALRSQKSTIEANSPDSWKLIYDTGKVIGTKGQTSVKVVFTRIGKIITSYPVK